jgi:hypothetical protein
MPSRASWVSLNDAQLLAQCVVDTYRASGPGGQKRNKTSSAVRIRHLPSRLIVIAEESRSQHENRARAIKRLRQAFYLQVREELPESSLTAPSISQLLDYQAARDKSGRLSLGRKDPRFWPAAGVVLDVLHATGARVRQAAELLGTSTANLVSFLECDPRLWQQANQLRASFGQKPLVLSR